MAFFTSPSAGWIEAPDIYVAAKWLMHRTTHATYGERAIVRSLEIGGAGSDSNGIVARAWIGAPAPGAGRLEWTAIEVYDITEYF